MNQMLAKFVDESKYKEIVSSILSLAKELGADQAEVGASCSQGLNVNVRLGEVENIEFNRDKTVAISVYVNQHKGSASTTDLSPEALKATVEAALNIAKYTEQDRCAGLADKESMATDIPDLDLYHPWEGSVEDAKALALECEKAALAFDKRIINSDGACLSSGQNFHVYGNSHGFIGGYPSSVHSLSCSVIGEEKGMQTDYQYTLSRRFEELASPEQVGYEAAMRTVKRLNPRKIPTQNVPVLFHASMAASLISPFLSAISGDALYRQASFLLDSKGTSVFNEKVSLLEAPRLLGGLASAPFDAEGIATRSQNIVSNGMLETYLLNSYSARKLKLPNTGHGGGAHNVLMQFHGSDLSFEALLKQMGTGLLVTELMGQGVNPVTGDYSRGASGFWVEQGEIQYPVHEITIAGNLKTMYQQILGVGQDVDKRRSIQTGSVLIENMMVAGLSA